MVGREKEGTTSESWLQVLVSSRAPTKNSQTRVTLFSTFLPLSHALLSPDGGRRTGCCSNRQIRKIAMSAPQNNAGNNLAVNVSIEASDEYQVQEITYDGVEKYVQ